MKPDWSIPAMAQGTKPDASGMLKQLLALPAPLPGNTETGELKLEPVEKDKQKLIQAVANDPQRISELLPLVTSSDAELMKELFDRAPSEELKKWLVYNSKYFLDELLAQASKVKDDTQYGSIHKGNELKTLAKLDWPTAAPLIQSVAETGQQRSSSLAISLLYQHAIETGDTSSEDKFRKQLQTIAADKNFPGWGRDTAIEALSKTNWYGRDDWYIDLLQDESLMQLSDAQHGFSPLGTIFFADPDKWIPIMTKLVGGTNTTVQKSAASCLVRYAIKTPRRDAILPVLRWLTEPDWLPMGNSTERAWFIQQMDELEMPESIPGLIWIIENEEWNARWAARTIAHYKDPRAIPALRKALAREDEDDRAMILEGLIASGGLPEAEAIDGLEKFAAKMATLEGRAAMIELYYPDGEQPLPISIGRYLANRKEVAPEIVRAMLARATELRKQNPALSQSLLRIAQRWQSRHVDLDVVNRIVAGTADAETIASVLERREKMRESLGPDLQLLTRAGGVAQSIGSILIGDNVLAQTILGSGDQPAQIALLASARLTQTSLPVVVVVPLLKSKNSLLAQAAERYLLVEDSKEAQTALWQHHPDQGFITGWRENIQFISGSNFDAFGKTEEQLRSELFKENGPTEIFALVMNAGFYHRVLRVYGDRAVYTHYEDPARYRERVISRTELSVFKQFVDTDKLEELGPQIGPCHHDCWVSEFVALKKERGRRVFSHQGFGGWSMLIENFDLLGRGPDAKIRYALESQIKGLEVLYAGGEPAVKDVWQHGDEIRVFTERNYTDEEIKERDKANDDDADDEDAKREQSRREAALFRARFSWRKLAGGKLTDVAAQPEEYPSVVMAKADTNWSDSNYVVRFNLETGREIRVNAEPADDFRPVVFLPSHGKVLLRRARDQHPVRGKPGGPDRPEYYLLTPNTGEARLVSGEFAPLLQEGNRFLQATGKTDEFWAAIPDETKDQTQVGRYNLKTFAFSPVLTIPHLIFDSMSMWADEKRGKIYIAYEGQLLSIPLQSAAVGGD